MKREGRVTPDEVVVMIALVGKLDPECYPGNKAKSIIYKCKSFLANPPDTLVVVR